MGLQKYGIIFTNDKLAEILITIELGWSFKNSESYRTFLIKHCLVAKGIIKRGFYLVNLLVYA